MFNRSSKTLRVPVTTNLKSERDRRLKRIRFQVAPHTI